MRGKRTSAQHRRDYADQLFRRVVRERDNMACQTATEWGIPCWGPLEVAHFFPRRHLAVRWNPDNAILLCASHHRHMDTHEYLKWALLVEWRGQATLNELGLAVTAGWDRDYDRVIEELKAG